MASPKRNIVTFQDLVHYATRFTKYTYIALLLCLLGIAGSLAFYTYGQPTYYSRSQVAYSNITLPIESETSDKVGHGRYAQMSFALAQGMNSRWLVEATAQRLGLVGEVGQYEMIRDRFVPKVMVSILPGSLLQIEVWSYDPRLVKAWPEVMIQAYRDSTVEARARHREVAAETYTEELQRLRERIHSDNSSRSKFEEENQLIEQYINNQGIEAVPSELLTVKTRLDLMAEVESILADPALSVIERIATLDRFNATPVPVGTIIRRGEQDPLVMRVPSTLGGTSTALRTDSQLDDGPMLGINGMPLKNQTQIVLPSMVEQIEPWRATEREARALDLEVEQLSRRYLPNHPQMRELREKRARLMLSLEKEYTTMLNNFRLQASQLKTKREELQKRLPEYRKVINDFDQYKKEFSLRSGSNMLWDQAYTTLQRRLTAMEYTGIEMKVEFEFKGFTLLRDQDPITPSKLKLLIYAVVLGVGLAGGSCLAMEHLRSTTSLVVDTEKMTGLNALGVVPMCGVEKLNAFAPATAGEHMQLSETFRIIRCSIPLHVSPQNPCQVIMVSSARPNEGKTTTSSLLARSFAETDQRTLLIDADLRRGRIHRQFVQEQNEGMAGYLSGEVTDLDKLVMKTPVPNLDLLSRGKKSFTRFEVLSSPLFRNLMAELRRRYDRIIIDNPPLLGLADALMVSGSVDGMVMVVRADRTTQRDIRTAIEIVQATQTPIYGFVLNGVDLSRLENYYYYTSYYPKYYDPTYLQLPPVEATST
jgi:capsular exopolysaccharide synthesis family protein